MKIYHETQNKRIERKIKTDDKMKRLLKNLKQKIKRKI